MQILTKIKTSILMMFLVIGLVNFLYPIFFRSQAPHGFVPIDVLYHGSPNNNVKIFEPRHIHIRDEQEGPVVFATPSIKLASCYLFKWDDSWVHQSISWIDGNKANYQVNMVISDKTRFLEADNGGTIYMVPVNGFDYNEKGLGVYEWINKQSVKPLLQMHFNLSLEAMEKFGVKVYFVNAAQFQHYLSMPHDKQKTFLLELNKKI